MEYLELEEEYNQEGVCVDRKINGVSLPSDTHPSVSLTGEDIKNAKWIKRKSFLTPEEVKNRYPTTQ